MKGYGSNREVKTEKHFSVVTEKGEESYDQYDATYNWKDIEGEIVLSARVGGKNVTLLKLTENMYRKLTLSVRSDDDIVEVLQKQLELKKNDQEVVS